MIVSQGLRSVTQTVGCVGSLLFISSEMTSVIAVTLPLMIGVGTLLGRALRRWSRQAQDQVRTCTLVYTCTYLSIPVCAYMYCTYMYLDEKKRRLLSEARV